MKYFDLHSSSPLTDARPGTLKDLHDQSLFRIFYLLGQVWSFSSISMAGEVIFYYYIDGDACLATRPWTHDQNLMSAHRVLLPLCPFIFFLFYFSLSMLSCFVYFCFLDGVWLGNTMVCFVKGGRVAQKRWMEM